MGEIADAMVDYYTERNFGLVPGSSEAFHKARRMLLDNNHLERNPPTMATVQKQTVTKRKRPKPVASSSPKKTTTKTARKKTAKTPTQTGTGFYGKSPVSLMFYGTPGVGKTEWAAHWPKPGFITDPQEDGIRDLVEFKRCPEPQWIQEVDSFTGLLDLTHNIAAGDSGIQTAVFDSFTGFEQLMFAHHCEEHFDGDWSSKGFTAYQQGPKNAAKTDLNDWIDGLVAINKAGINVILILHSEVKIFNNPEGPDYERYIPVCDKSCWQRLHRWAKAVLFMNYYVEIESKKKTGPRTKANPDSDERFIYTTWSPAYDAKNRWGLEPLIDAGENGKEGFANFAEAFKAAAAA